MDYIRVTAENLEKEHVCCAISSNKDCQVMAKKGWLADRFADGLVFLKGNVRGKCFIEYLPAEKAWAPIEADGYTYIDCFWIAGQFKGRGCANDLLAACVEDSKAQGRQGLCVLTSRKKKMPFLSDPGYLTHKGFQLADTAEPFFALVYLPFDKSAPVPKFRDCVGKAPASDKGFVLYYADQCPYTAKYVPILSACAKSHGISMQTIHIKTAEQAQKMPCPCTSFALFRDGEFVTNEIQSEAKFLKLAGGD